MIGETGPSAISSIGAYRTLQGAYTTLSVPGSTETLAAGIDDPGEVCGTYSAGGVANGFVYRNGAYATHASVNPPPLRVPSTITRAAHFRTRRERCCLFPLDGFWFTTS
jgi:hypothetical protein